jgi:hypothetical protein
MIKSALKYQPEGERRREIENLLREVENRVSGSIYTPSSGTGVLKRKQRIK